MNGQFNLGDISVRNYFGSIAVTCGLLFAFIDDFPSGFTNSLLHLMQWQLQALAPMALLYFVQSSLAHVKLFGAINPWVQLTIGGIAATLIFAPIALSIEIVFGEVIENPLWREVIQEYMFTAPPIIICWLAINAPWFIGFRLVRTSQPEKCSEPQKCSEPMAKTPEFYALIPSDMRGELIYLKAELHYLAVITTKGKSLILYNLKDALSELPENSGIQTHRGSWVALAHALELKRINRQGEVIVSNGDHVPVSRSKIGLVEKAFSDYNSHQHLYIKGAD